MFTKTNLDNPKTYQVVDKSNFCQHLIDFPDLISDARQKALKFILPATLARFKNILLLAEGPEKAIAGLIKNFLENNSSQYPPIISSATLHEWVGENTLVIAINVSEEKSSSTNFFFRQAGMRKAKLLTICLENSHLSSLCRKFRAPYFEIDYGAPSWLLFPYLFIALLIFFDRLNILNLEKNILEEGGVIVKGQTAHFLPAVSRNHNEAKRLAGEIAKRQAILFSPASLSGLADYWFWQLFLSGRELVFRQSINELAPAAFLAGPRINKITDFLGLILESKYESKNETAEKKIFISHLQKRRFTYETINIAIANSSLSELFNHISLANFTAYYLAILKGIDPAGQEEK